MLYIFGNDTMRIKKRLLSKRKGNIVLCLVFTVFLIAPNPSHQGRGDYNNRSRAACCGEVPSRCALPGDDHVEQLFESIEPRVLRDRVDGGAGDEGALVRVAIPHLDPERDLPGSGRVDLQGTFGEVSHGKLPGAFKQDSVPAEIADDRCYEFLFPRYREREVLPAGIWNFMPLLFPIVDLHMAAASGNADVSDATLPFSERFCAKRSV